MPKATFPHLVEAAAGAGFDAVTISPALHLDVADDGGRTARQLLQSTGVHVAVVDPLIHPLPGLPPLTEVAPDHLPFLERTADDALRLADAVGAEAINVAHFLGRHVPVAQLADAIGVISDRAVAAGVAVTLEFIPDTGVPDLPTALAIVSAVGGGSLGVMLDSWHLARSGGTPADVAAAPAGTIGGVQLCDRIPPAPGEAYVPMAGRLLPGEGELPLADLVASVLSVSPSVTFGIEVFDADLAAAPTADAAARAGAALRSVMPA